MSFQAFERDEIEAAHARAGRLYHEFLRVPAMSVGLYRLPAGATDSQKPHEQDELYLVLEGRGAFVVGEERRPVTAGSLLFVPGRAEHRFVDIEEDLSILVVVAPAEG